MPVMLVTGANRGLGLELVRQYAAEGWRVHATCRRLDEAGELRGIRGEVAIHQLDVRDRAAYPGLAKALESEAIDLLIANAGVDGPCDSLEALDVPGWLETLEVNTIAPVLLAVALRHQVARSRERKVVGITSGLGSIKDNRSGGHLAYRTSKAGLNMAFRTLAVDLRGEGIIVAVVHPGWARTRMGGPNASQSAEQAVRQMRTVLSGLTMAHSGRFFSYRGDPVPW
jgi:NAD(P)-dependent dehydrogenase (short-subunit alcohol dehydrogenase family)